MERGRISALDGLRGLAALGVVGFHVGEQLDPRFHDGRIDWLPVGGHLGVPVFFALSGYLITSLLLREFDRRGTVSLRLFYLRRAARLLPLLVVVVAVVLVSSLIAGGDRADHVIQAVLAMGYVENIALAVSSWGDVHGYVWAWSLAQEEQFYLLWPPMLMYLIWRRRDRRAIAWALIGLTVLVWLSRSVTITGGNQVDAMFAPWNRIDGLALGAAAALVPVDVPLRVARLAVPTALLVLGGLYWSAAIFTPSTYTVAMTLAPLCAVVAIVAGQSAPGVLAWRPLVHLGRISYGIYLWPAALSLLHPVVPGDSGAGGEVALVLLVVPVAHLSWRFFESPIIAAARSASLAQEAVAGPPGPEVPATQRGRELPIS